MISATVNVNESSNTGILTNDNVEFQKNLENSEPMRAYWVANNFTTVQFLE